MKMPSVTISFTEAATAAVKRGERGIIAMILKDIVPAENPVRCVTEEDIPAELSEAGKQQIRLALKGYVNTPNSVIVYMIGKSEENYETALNYLKTVRFDYLVAPSVETDGQLSAVTSYVKNERKANKLIKAVLPNATADSGSSITQRKQYMKTTRNTRRNSIVRELPVLSQEHRSRFPVLTHRFQN